MGLANDHSPGAVCHLISPHAEAEMTAGVVDSTERTRGMQVAQVGDRVSAPRQRQSWVPPRRTIGTVGIGASLVGVGYFVWLVGLRSADGYVTPRHTATAVLIIVGLQVARWAFDAQAAANRRDAERADLADVTIRQSRILARQEELVSRMPSRTELANEIESMVGRAVESTYAGGYVNGVRRRLRGHLRSVQSDD